MDYYEQLDQQIKAVSPSCVGQSFNDKQEVITLCFQEERGFKNTFSPDDCKTDEQRSAWKVVQSFVFVPSPPEQTLEERISALEIQVSKIEGVTIVEKVV